MPVEEEKLKKASSNVEIAIKYQLMVHGIKQKDLAKRFNTTPAQINRAIKGSNDPRSVEIRMMIYRELGMLED